MAGTVEVASGVVVEELTVVDVAAREADAGGVELQTAFMVGVAEPPPALSRRPFRCHEVPVGLVQVWASPDGPVPSATQPVAE